ncbi:hypothetical protein JOD17_003398 [Geomicrobium sediminis]|uniref:Uncharacterized protein n=1 Tax=Geomicrobium sediminis TaxID=1347788 RepID=A0ABS2PH68_9BACL|nr:hypothetical protein [Geomicrobium sediminis]
MCIIPSDLYYVLAINHYGMSVLASKQRVLLASLLTFGNLDMESYKKYSIRSIFEESSFCKLNSWCTGWALLALGIVQGEEIFAMN